jgi:flagellar assembly protein FliH
LSRIIKFASVQEEPLIINNHRPAFAIVEQTEDSAAEPEREQIQEAIDEAKKILDDAKKQAETCISQALQEAEQLRQQACEAGRQEGYQAGYSEGVRQGKEQAELEMTNKINSASETAENILADARQEYQETLIKAEREIVKIALAVARKILAREIDENPTVILPIVKTALEKVRDQESIIIRVNPIDYDIVVQSKRDLQIMIGCEDALSVVSDNTVSPGGCMIDTPYGTVDASLDIQFEAIKRALEEIMP